VVQVVPVTRLPNRDFRAYEALISPGESGVDRPSRLVANQIRTVSRTRIFEILGHLSEEEQLALDRAIRIQLGLGID
jgi:mRNA interferase MazF